MDSSNANYLIKSIFQENQMLDYLLNDSQKLNNSQNFLSTLSNRKLQELHKQLTFIVEIDKLKNVHRRNKIVDQSRQENSAEHSWHIAIMAMILHQYSEKDIDITKVIEMLLIHDLVEVNAGDTYCYDSDLVKKQKQFEEKSANKIFNILPKSQANRFRELWDEFEGRKTPESKFANSVDRLHPFLNIYLSKGQSWQKNGIKKQQVLQRMEPVRDGSSLLWSIVHSLIDDACSKGFLDK